MKSDFGRGYATCLRQFLNHANRLQEHVALYRQMHDKYPDSFSDQRTVGLWASGASDHLAELRKPRRWVKRNEWADAKGVQDQMFAWRWHDDQATLTKAEALLISANALLALFGERSRTIYPATLEQAMELDRMAGLAPEAGSWSCPEDLKRERSS